MTKPAETRISETIDFIKNWNGSTAAKRKIAVEFVKEEIDKVHKPNSAGRVKFSESMSQAKNRNAGDKNTRARRRACHILVSALGRPNDAAGFNNRPSGSLDADLRGLIEEAYWYGDESGAACNDVLQNKIKHDTAQFLKDYPVVFSTGKTKGKVRLRLTYASAKKRFEVGVAKDNAGCTFEAINFPPVAWHSCNKNGYSEVEGVKLEGADIAITTQFTGCSFCYKYHQGHLYAAHIWPDGNPKTQKNPQLRKEGDILTRELEGGNFRGTDVNTKFEVYGRGGTGLDGYGMQVQGMHILGVHKTNQWHIYSQHVFKGNERKVYQLLPGEPRLL